MTKEQIIRKLTSRKFWITVISNAIGIFTLLTASENAEVRVVASVALIICTNVSYIFGESKIDAIGVTKNVIDTVENIKDVINDYKEGKGTEEEVPAITTEETTPEETPNA